MALSGLALLPTQYDMLRFQYTREARVEFHFCTPRVELGIRFEANPSARSEHAGHDR